MSSSTPSDLCADGAATASAATPAAARATPRDEVVLRLNGWLRQADPATGAPPAQACAAAREALALARQLGRCVEQGRAAAWVCAHLQGLGSHAEMLAEAAAALALLTGPELAADRRELLRLVALSASETGAHDRALDAAHELVRLTANLGDDGAALNAAYGLAVCFERTGDSWQAERLLTQALHDHGAGSPARLRMITCNALCAVSIGVMHRLLGTEPDAEVRAVLSSARQHGEQARALLALAPDPTYEVTILGNLGEVLLYQGELQDAEPLLRQSHTLAVQRGLRAHAWRVQVSLASWMLACGRPEDALARAQGLIAEAAGLAVALPQQTATRAHHVAYRACRQLGQFERALAHFEVVESIERRRATAQLRAQSQLFVTRTETQQAQWRAEQARLDAARHSQRAAEYAETAQRDPLTGLGNRRHLDRRRAELLPQGQRDQTPLALALIDIDHFKRVNDHHGHSAGDQVLVTLAQLLRENMRSGDVLIRYGGEEFLMLLPGMPHDRAVEVCERLREHVAAHDWATDQARQLAVTVSIGLASAPPWDWPTLLARADAALYEAKRSGRNQLAVGG